MLLFLLALAIPFYFFSKGIEVSEMGWEFTAPFQAIVLVSIESFLILEALRRVAGKALAIICAFFFLFPLFTSYMPGLLKGTAYSFPDLASFMGFSREGLMGITTRAFGELLIGFMIFAIAIIHTGAGRFFINLANALLGHTRGGPAKVSIAASALFGSMSGSVLSNVVTTGSVTIPTIKRAGYPAEYAGATEACASTGGVLMPPVMGAAAFIMAQFLGMPYFFIIVAAIIPSILYYLALFLQIDGYAAKEGFKGLSRAELPSLKQTFKEGWIYIFAFLLLMYFLVYERVEAMAPYHATASLLALAMLRKETRLNIKSFIGFIEGTGKLLVELMVILGGIGFITGSLSMTGVGYGLSSGIIALAGGNLFLLLILGAVGSGILGMGMTISACYVFLAITLAPALVKLGFCPLAIHLFIMYCGMVSYLTPPVALGAYAAAEIAGSAPVKTGLRAMRLGIAIYIVPFLFVLNPALIFEGTAVEIISAILPTLAGVVLIAQAMEGYLMGAGRISESARTSVILSGILLLAFSCITGLHISGWSIMICILGAIILAFTIGAIRLFPKKFLVELQESSKEETE